MSDKMKSSNLYFPEFGGSTGGWLETAETEEGAEDDAAQEDATEEPAAVLAAVSWSLLVLIKGLGQKCDKISSDFS